MKFLLAALNAKYIHSNPALYSLRAYAEKYHPEAAEQVKLAEYTINQTVEEILADLYERKPDAVAFSCYIWNWKMMQEVISALHQVRPELPIWLGGPEVSYHAEEVLEQFPFLTGIMVGEGEVTFSELLTFYEKKNSVSGTAAAADCGILAGSSKAGGTGQHCRCCLPRSGYGGDCADKGAPADQYQRDSVLL